MGRKRVQVARPVDAVQVALDREITKRGGDIKPIELVKVAVSAYLSFTFSDEDILVNSKATCVESEDCAGLRRGTQSAVDRLLFNANYWRAAYETRIIEACDSPEDALACLKAVAIWSAHPLKLNTLTPEAVVDTFERFCPPFAINQRRGSSNARGGKGPLPDFRHAIDAIAERDAGGGSATVERLLQLLSTMETEAATYATLGEAYSLIALYNILPAWCLQNRIELVGGSWWDDADVMAAIVSTLHQRFLELGANESVCQYFLDSCNEALDAYYRDLSSEPSPFADWDIPRLIALIQQARENYPSFETDGYGSELPAWLISKEQLVWNVLVCAIYGPASARPLLVDSPAQLAQEGYSDKTDVITELARTSFDRYNADRIASQSDQQFASFASLPPDLRDSSIAYIASIHKKLETLGYEVLPAGTCYPDRCVNAFTESEVECLAILEHRRWLQERQKAGWRYGAAKDVEAKRSPYLVPWEELPDRAKEWNRSAVRSIPSLLASVNLTVVK